jgi:hypothetical protein
MFVHARHAGDITPDVRGSQALTEGLTRHKERASAVVARELSTRDLADLYRHAEKRGFYGLAVDRREGVAGVLRRAAGELGPDELTARRIARHLELELDDATVGAVRQLNDALDPGDRDRTTARGVGYLNWLAHNVRADLPARELPATYLRARDAAFYGENGAGREGLVRALRQADRQLHPHPAPADLTGLPEPMAWDPHTQVLQRLIDEAAVPSERWPVSGGPSPYGPIDHLAAAADPGIFRNSPLDTYLDRWRRLEEEFPDVGWRTDRKLLFRGDTRSDVEGILEAGFHPNPANDRTNEHGLVCFSRTSRSAGPAPVKAHTAST